MKLDPMLLAHPCVFAVENEYQIMVGVQKKCLFWVEVGDERFSDASAGVLRSDTTTHSVRVPMERLNRAGKYTVCFRTEIERQPYFPQFAPVVRLEYSFRPLREEGELNIYHISDAHSRVDMPVMAGSFFGENLDLLVLNGDVLNHAGSPRDMQTVLLVGGKLCGGRIPIVCSRGNHDMRGILAERVADYLPSDRGNFFYTFRLGRVWGIVMDCAEDKPDTNDEYGGTIVCHEYRLAQTAMLKQIAKERPFDAEGIEYKLVIVHNPFGYIIRPPFDIEQDTYKEWCDILREQIKPDLMLCGHHHITRVAKCGSDFDHQGQPCTVIVGSRPTECGFEGCALTLAGKRAKICFNDQTGRVLSEEWIEIE